MSSQLVHLELIRKARSLEILFSFGRVLKTQNTSSYRRKYIHIKFVILQFFCIATNNLVSETQLYLIIWNILKLTVGSTLLPLLSLQSCPTLCDPIDGSPPGSSSLGSPGKNTGVGCHFLLQCTKVKSESEVTQLCGTLCDAMKCSLPGSSVHGIFQARVLEWGATAFSRIIH